MTTVSVDQVASVRAVLTGDVDTFDRITDRLSSEERDARGVFVAAAFAEAAYRRFAKAVDPSAAVIRFVSDLRAQHPLTEDFDQHTAERLLLATFTDESTSDVPAETKGSYYMLLLAGIVKVVGLSDAQLDTFLDDARKLADEWLAADTS
ncbi:hypothetical protein [Actinomadura chibensis]|uniref:Uncharacterized protein n=1 Tax=Actinomadura chibensis TaxID=392828 RepID=A0A5D0NX45_9ACTN|nr:hypothetical protein [Actinomadura chibensis]TYB48689.1 hypothetical protein FXF69_05805 [Actinomadura chibensis]